MSSSTATLEAERYALQARLDTGRTQAERNRRGQFATGPALAQDMLRQAADLMPAGEPIRFLDPAIGTGVFYSALQDVFPPTRIAGALGFEIDPHYGKPASALWRGAKLEYRLEDFTRAAGIPLFNLIVCNPPYVRHHHLSNTAKIRLQRRTQAASGIKLGGLSGLYCHFVCLAHAWMTDGGIGVWLIPSEFMDVNYGQVLKRYLLEKVTLLHIHRFDPHNVQFPDALVSSAVVWIKKAPTPKGHTVEFTFGGTLAKPEVARSIAPRALASEAKWTRFPTARVRRRQTTPTIEDFFHVRRGLATGDNGYFILSPEQIRAWKLPRELMQPILPSPRYLTADRIDADRQGRPLVERTLFLFDTRLTENEIAHRWPALAAYLQEGRRRGIHKRYLCRHRPLWYAQENRPPAPIVCTYVGRRDAARSRPFRFILNLSRATAANSYLLMYPKPSLAEALEQDSTLLERVWNVLNGITATELLGQGRVYGGGLHKLEPKELARVAVPQLRKLLADPRAVQTVNQLNSESAQRQRRIISAQSATRRPRRGSHRDPASRRRE